jgi:predicted nucleotidyltransferase
MGKYSEETLRNYCFSVSDAEQRRIENAKSMIKSAINDSSELNGLDYEIFEQGSYANNTNIRIESDIDICVMLTSTFYIEYPDGLTREYYGFSMGTMDYDDYKQRTIRALSKKFGADIKIGNKSIKISSNSYRVNADVVVAFQYRNYRRLNSRNPNIYTEGIKFISKSGDIVINYHKRHIENSISKNKLTSLQYKKLIKIFKNIKNNMIDEKIINSDTISSFLIEALIYNIPNDKIIAFDSWDNRVRNAIYYLWNEFDKNQYNRWVEPSQCIDLFHNDRKWTKEGTKDFLLKMWQHMEYK